MSPQGLQTSFWAMIALQTIGSVDLPGKGARKLPSPRQYVAIVVAWVILQLVSGFGAGASRAAAGLGWLLVLAGIVAGPFGQRLVNLFSTVAAQFAPQGTALAAAETAAGGPGVASTLTPYAPQGTTLIPGG